MGVMLDTTTIEELLPEMDNYIKNVLKCKYGETTYKMFPVSELGDDSITVHFHYGKEPGNTHEYFGEFSLSTFPGNCGMVVSHGLYLGTSTRRKGIGKFLQYFKIKLANAYGYTLMKCTTLETNEVENHLLEIFGWQVVNKFTNRRTGNICLEWIREVPEKLPL